MKRSRPWAVPAALLAAGFAIRAALYFPLAAFPIDSDGVLAGLCAFQIGDGHYPAFFPGGSRLSAASCYVAAAYFRLLGPGRAGLALVGLTWALLYLIFSYAFLRAALGRRAANVAFLYAAVPAAAFVTVTYVPWAYGEIAASCAATLWLAALWRAQGRAWQRVAFGISAGFGIWISLQTLMIALPAFAWIALSRRAPTVREAPLALLGAVAGALPFWLGNVGRGFPSFTQNWAALPAADPGMVWKNFVWLIGAPLPQLLFSGTSGWAAAVIAAGCVAAAAGFVLALRDRDRDTGATVGARGAGVLLALVMVFSIGLYAASQAGSIRGWTVRYIAPLYVAMPLLLGIGTCAWWRRQRWAAVATAAALIVPNVLQYSLPGSPARAVLTAQLQTDAALRALLARRHVTLVYGDYFLVYHLNFDSRRSVAGIPTVAVVDYLDYAATLPPRGVRWALLGQDRATLLAWARAADARGSLTPVDGLELFVAGEPAAGSGALLTTLRRASLQVP
ncbi:MAG TPA: hypothetical protein VFU90_02530 [Candidatus Tumulicola sp.]|nr:hypothetical protein [Candidatus Tumulicola sp.]